jgi:hypothetical protein
MVFLPSACVTLVGASVRTSIQHITGRADSEIDNPRLAVVGSFLYSRRSMRVVEWDLLLPISFPPDSDIDKVSIRSRLSRY